MGNRVYKKRPASLIEQKMAVEKKFPDFRFRQVQGGAIWTGDLQPTPLSENYRVKIEHNQTTSPNVYVLRPNLVERLIPHTYPGNRLCLFHPQKGEWTNQMLIAETIIPWTSLWLLFYESWLVTGEWLGGGEHPEIKQKRKGVLI